MCVCVCGWGGGGGGRANLYRHVFVMVYLRRWINVETSLLHRCVLAKYYAGPVDPNVSPI